MSFKLYQFSYVAKYFILGLFFSTVTMAESSNVELHAETWDMPRHGEMLLKVPELAQFVKQWMKYPQQKIELRYPGGEAGELWVNELKDWLVSLGVQSDVIQTSQGSDAEDVINLVLIKMVKNNE